jgi:hypothetical protein
MPLDIVSNFNINRLEKMYLFILLNMLVRSWRCLVLQNTTNTDGTVDRTTTNDYSMAKRVIAGNPFPTLMTGLILLIIKELISLLLFENASIYNSAGIYQSVAADYFDNQTVDQLNRWQNPGDITNVPQARLYGGNGTGASTRFLDKSDFIRLQFNLRLFIEQ